MTTTTTTSRASIRDTDWRWILRLFPRNLDALAKETEAVTFFRELRSGEILLRLLLLWSLGSMGLRSVSAWAAKSFIFGMLFLKRLSDVFDEEVDALIAEGHSREIALTDADYHTFFVPPKARWAEIQSNRCVSRRRSSLRAVVAESRACEPAILMISKRADASVSTPGAAAA
jgi:hypothetical protein